MAISRGQITIVDLNDAKSLNLYLSANQPTTQIFNRENSSFVPNYTESSLVISPELYVSGTSANVINNIKTPGPVWKINDSDDLAKFGATATASPYALTIKNNMTTISQMKVECEVIFVDPVTGVETKSKSVITFTKTENTGQLITAISYAPKGTIFKQGVESLKAHCDLWRGSKIDNTNVDYKWFKLSDGTWTELTDTTNFGITGFTTNEITIPSSAVLNFESFKCEIKDTDTSSGTFGTTVSDIISFADLTDPYQIVLVSPAGDKIVNGLGSIKIIAEIWQNGEEIPNDTAKTKFHYSWKKFDKDGNLDKNWKPNTEDWGQIITVTNADVSIKATFVCEITLRQQ